MEFGESAKEVRKKTTEQIPPSVEAPDLPIDDLRARLYETAEFSPRAGILEAWLLVETAAIELVRARGINEFRSHPGPQRLGTYLVKAQALTAGQQEVFERLRQLRNEAVHRAEAEFTTAAARDYIDAAFMIAAYFRSLLTR